MLETITRLFRLLASLPELIALGGYTVLFLVVFVETGIMVGFFLPGDSLLVTAGLFAARGDLNILALIALLTVAAILGDSLGYLIGFKTGHALFHKEDSRLFKKKYLLAAQTFYDKHGGKTIFLARFVPIIRTFAPVVAGIARMDYKRFLSYNVIGGFSWTTSMLLLGYYLGKSIPNIDQNIHIVVFIVILLSFAPMIAEYIKLKRKRATIHHPPGERVKKTRIHPNRNTPPIP